MKMRLPVLAPMLTGLLAACASTPTVHTDFDPGASFTAYRTYSWGLQPQTTAPLANQRIVAGVDARLQARGLHPVASNGDLVVAAQVTTSQKTTIDTMYTGTGMGGWGWRGGWGGGVGMASSTSQVRQYEVGTLIVDLFDGKTQQAVWRGTASGTVSESPDRNVAALEAGLDKMFASYPPGAAPAAN